MYRETSWIVVTGLIVLLASFGGCRADEALKDCSECPILVKVPPGRFLMGSTDAELKREKNNDPRLQRERPQHRVTIDYGFAIGKYSVTRGEFAAFAEATHYDASGCWVFMLGSFNLGKSLSWRDPGFKQTDADPSVCISFEDAHAYVQWLSQKTGHRYRLPSEAEWEYTARAGTTTARFWGDDRKSACTYANTADLSAAEALQWPTDEETVFQCKDGYVYTAPGGSFRPNAFGLYDMLGNAWQWTEDCFHQDYSGAPSDGSAWRGDQCKYRVLRGSSWRGNPSNVRSAYRLPFDAAIRQDITGFRVVRDLTP
jgi:formylglycine-generating enzyme